MNVQLLLKPWKQLIKTLNDLSATSKPHTLEGITTIIDAAKLLENSKPLPEKMLQNPEWESEPSRAEAEALVSKLRQYRELKTFVDKTFYPSVFDLDTSEFEELVPQVPQGYKSQVQKTQKRNFILLYFRDFLPRIIGFFLTSPAFPNVKPAGWSLKVPRQKVKNTSQITGRALKVILPFWMNTAGG